jgi:perosamine synthetase
VAVPDIGSLEAAYVNDALGSGWISSIGEFIERFEDDFARFCEVRHAVTVANGTGALVVALKALRVGPGDEVVVPALTFAAVPAAVCHVGATPVLADVDAAHWCIDPAAIKRAVSPRTKAVVVVHSYGHPADMEAVLAVCGPPGIAVVEDCAEAHGARYRGRRVGSIGHLGTFSFYGNKIITTGEGGMVTTDDPELAARVRMLRDHAMDPQRRYYHLDVGYNFRMTNLQAAIGCAQLQRIDQFLERRQALLQSYRDQLESVPGLRLNPRMTWAEPVNWMVCVTLPGDRARSRDEVMMELRRRGADSRPFFVPLCEMPPYRGLRTVGARGPAMPIATEVAAAGLNLPTSTTLVEADVRYIADHLRSCLR